MTNVPEQVSGIADDSRSIMDFTINTLKLGELGICPTPVQQFILKEFYRNSLWNDVPDHYIPSGVEAKGIFSKDPFAYFNELVLQLGRRAGKTFLASIIVNYEFFKLVYGEPYNKTNVVVLVVSPTRASAKLMFQEIKTRFLHSTFFPPLEPALKFTSNSIVYTDAYGRTVEIRCATANPESMVGICAHTLILNDVGQSRSPESLYAMLRPTISTFNDPANMGKIILTGNGSELVERAFQSEHPHRMGVRAPTWVINPKYTERALREEFAGMSEVEFRVQYGAEYVAEDPTEQVTLRIRKSVVDRLKRVARHRAFDEDRDVLYTDVIREILEANA